MAKLKEGICLIDKPLGVTSFEVVRRLKAQRNEKKVGHAGTLDPLATGLMIIGYGAGTKLLHEYQMLPKVYEAEICLGEKSTTGDKEGEVLERCTVKTLSPETITNALESMIGILRLPVSIYSAMKKGGEEFYKKARRGEHPTPPQRDMEIFETELLKIHEKRDSNLFIDVRFSVGSGTYIRSLAEELGKRLGYPARLENLRRTQVGEFRVEDAQELS